MAGVFDMFSTDDPQQAARMALIAGLLGGKGNFNSVVGQAMMGSQKAFQANRAAQQEAELNKTQIEEVNRKSKLARDQAALDEQFRALIPNPQQASLDAALGGGGGPTNANAAKQVPVDPARQLEYDAMRYGQMPASAFIQNVTGREDRQAAAREAQAERGRQATEMQAARAVDELHKQRERLTAQQQLAQILAANRPPRAEQPLVEIVGPDGKRQWATREQAVGRQAPDKVGTAVEKNLTEDQGKAVSWLERMDQSEKIIKDAPAAALQSTGSLGGMLGATIGSVPYLGGTGVAKLSRNTVESPERQAVRTAQEVWVQGLLRSDTGAAYKDMEKDDIIRAFFWQPGESESVRTQKDLARDGVRRAMLVRAGPAVDRLSKVPKTGVSGKWTIEVEK